MSNEFLDLNNFKLLEKIGQGSFGKVFIVEEKSTGQIYAAKISLKEISGEEDSLLVNLKREINIMAQLNHPSILKFIGYSPINFKQQSKPVIITEFSSNDTLENIIKLESLSLAPKSWDETKKLINIYGIASAMAYLHKHNIIHRDLKPANILEDDYLFPKIADFGLSKMNHQNQESMSLQSVTGIKGTPIYIPPESWDTNEYTKAGDVYAFSIILYELVTLEPPFKDFTIPMICSKVVHGNYHPPFNFPIPECYKNLIEQCWSRNPEERPTFDEIVEELKTNEEFLENGVDSGEFLNYVDWVDNSKSSFDPSKKFKKIILSEIPEKVRETDQISAEKVTETLVEEKVTEPTKQSKPSKHHSSHRHSSRHHHKDEVSKLLTDFDITPEQRDLFKKVKLDVLKGILTFDPQQTQIILTNKWIASGPFVDSLKSFNSIVFELNFPSDSLSNDDIRDFCSFLKENKTMTLFAIVTQMPNSLNYLSKLFFSLTLTFSPTVKKIDNSYFENNVALRRLIIPSGVEIIGDSSFKGCEYLKEITIDMPSSLKVIGQKAFFGCPIKNVKGIPTALTTIEKQAFEESAINHIDLPSITTIESRAFKGAKIENIQIPSSIKSLENTAFKESSIKNITFQSPSQLTSIESHLFEKSSLREIVIPSPVTSIGISAFFLCQRLSSVVLPDSLTKIEDDAFNSTGLIEIVIPKSVTFIGRSAFSNCINLTKVIFEKESKLTKICESAFYECKKFDIISIPASVTEIEKNVFRECSLGQFSFDPNSQLSVIEEGLFNSCVGLKEIVIPASVTSIKYYAFNNCNILQIVNFEENSKLVEIDRFAFIGCHSLSSIKLPGSLKSIGQSAFKSCSSLREFVIPKSVESVGQEVFVDCSNLKQVAAPSSLKKSLSSSFLGVSKKVKIKKT